MFRVFQRRHRRKNKNEKEEKEERKEKDKCRETRIFFVRLEHRTRLYSTSDLSGRQTSNGWVRLVRLNRKRQDKILDINK